MKFTKKQLLNLIKEEVVKKEKLTNLQERKKQAEFELNKLFEEGFDFMNETEVKKYTFNVKHDKGKIKITTTASSEEVAINKIMNAEGCPRNAISKV